MRCVRGNTFETTADPAERWRDRAQAMRRVAASVDDPVTRDSLLALAAEWERMAVERETPWDAAEAAVSARRQGDVAVAGTLPVPSISFRM